MIRNIVGRDIRQRYAGSVMGLFWSIIHPLTQLLIYYFIFSVIFKMKLGPEYGGANYAIWLISGLLPWFLFSEIVTRSPMAVVEQSDLLKKMAFPSEILPVVQFSAAVINHLIGIAILFGFLIVLGYGISLNILWLPLYLLIIGILGLGIAWLLAALNVFLRDIAHVIGVFVNIMFFLTPIVYSYTLIPDKVRGIMGLNPMLHAIEGYRMALIGTDGIDLYGLLYMFLIALFLFVFGGMTFRKLKPSFVDVL